MKFFLLVTFLGLGFCDLRAQSPGAYFEKEIIYGRKDGMALTMHMLVPKTGRNGKAIINLVSGGWYSQEKWIPDYIEHARIFIQRGYTIFLVLHSSRPVFNIRDAIADAKRSVRFIRFHAREYHIDPWHIGITGSSSGGQISLAVATDDDKRESDPDDPVDSVSSRVQAAACFYPPSDFLHWGNITVDPKNKYVLDEADVYSAFEFKEWDPAHKNFILITDQKKMLGIYKEISPIYQISADDPPILIAHGNADVVVPFSQSEKFVEKLRQANITSELLVKEGGGHGGWKDEYNFQKAFADWFDKYLQ
jgi:acetyl esterase/lipase